MQLIEEVKTTLQLKLIRLWLAYAWILTVWVGEKYYEKLCFCVAHGVILFHQVWNPHQIVRANVCDGARIWWSFIKCFPFIYLFFLSDKCVLILSACGVADSSVGVLYWFNWWDGEWGERLGDCCSTAFVPTVFTRTHHCFFSKSFEETLEVCRIIWCDLCSFFSDFWMQKILLHSSFFSCFLCRQNSTDHRSYIIWNFEM